MLIEYIQAALERADYEIIEDEEPFYGEVPSLDGVWATGKTLQSPGNVRDKSSPAPGHPPPSPSQE
jgi:hypothetical protein